VDAGKNDEVVSKVSGGRSAPLATTENVFASGFLETPETLVQCETQRQSLLSCDV
jgi:hypothetical protein